MRLAPIRTGARCRSGPSSKGERAHPEGARRRCPLRSPARRPRPCVSRRGGARSRSRRTRDSPFPSDTWLGLIPSWFRLRSERMVHRGSRAALPPGCEGVEKEGCGGERDEVAQVHAAERERNGPNEARGSVHEGNSDDHRCDVGCESRHAPRWSRFRAWLLTANPEDEEEPALVERDPIGAAPHSEPGGDCASDEDGGPPPHGDVEGKKGESA